MAETPWNGSLIVMIGSYHVGLGDGSAGGARSTRIVVKATNSPIPAQAQAHGLGDA